MKQRILLLLLPLLLALGVRAQTTLLTEGFAVQPGTGTSKVDVANTTSYTNVATTGTTAATASTNQYFVRATNSPAPADVTNPAAPVAFGSTTQSAGVPAGGTFPTTDTFFWIGEGVRGPTGVLPLPRSPGIVTLTAVSVTGYTGLQVKIGLISLRANSVPSTVWENDDTLKIQTRFNGAGAWVTRGQFVGDNAITGSAGDLRQDTNLDGKSYDAADAGLSPIVGSPMSDFTFNVAGTGTTLQVRVVVSMNGLSEELAFDNIRVLGTLNSNAAPVLANLETTTINYAEGAAAVTVTSAITISDADNTTLSGGTVRIAGFDAAEDVLLFTNQNGISGSYNTATGVLTLTGTTTLANYQAALRSVQYRNNDAVDATGGNRTIEFAVTDAATVTSNTASRTIAVTASLDAALPPPYLDDLTTDGEGTRYKSNHFTGVNGAAFFRTNVANNNTANGPWFGGGRSPTNFTGISNGFYWYSAGPGNSINPAPVNVGTFVTKQVNAAGFSDLRFKILLGATTASWDSDDYTKLFYRANGGSWVIFASFRSTIQAVGTTGNMAQDADPTNLASAPTGTVLGPAMTQFDFALPAALNGQQVDFMIEEQSQDSGENGEVFLFDKIEVTGTASSPPTDIQLSNAAVAENAASGTAVGNFSSTDADVPAQTFTYALVSGTGSTDNGSFALVGNQLRTAAVFNFEVKSSYSIRVRTTDSGTPGQSFEKVFTVSVTNVNELAASIVAQLNVACNGGSGGSATVAASGESGPFTYDWTPGTPTGDGTTTVTGLTAQTYSVLVTATASGFTASTSVTITQPSAIATSAASQTNVACFGGSTGAASVSASGGVGGYTYNWTPGNPPGDGTASVTGLSAQTYTVTVTDANNCATTRSFAIGGPATALAASISASTNVSCRGGSNGTATAGASGGTPGYTYSWSPSGGSAATATGLAAGSYTVTVTDANSCTATAGVTIGQPAAVLAATQSQTNVACFGGTTGAAGVSASGGTPGYTYNWSPGTPTGDGTASVTGLTAGSWSVLITDANSCTITKSFTIGGPAAALTAGISPSTNVSCNGGSNGAATVNVSGGTPGYSYNWTPGNPTGDGTASVTGLTAGSYSVLITDANNCTTTASVTIGQPAALGVTPSQTNVSVAGGNTGAASVSVSGGTPGYTYDWSPGSPSGEGTNSVTGLTAGSWSVLITDANNCATTQNFTITQPGTAAPVVTAPANVTLLNTATPTYAGTGPAGSTITVFVDGSSIGTATATGGGNWSLTQPSALSQGTHTVNATATVGASTSPVSNTNGFTVDTVVPTVAISSTATSPTSTSPIPVTVTFSEAVSGFDLTDVAVTNGTASGFGGSGPTYTFNVTPAGSGAVTVNVAAGVAADGAGNGNAAAPQFSIQYNAPATASAWTGAASTDWFDPANWTGGVPTATLDAVIAVVGSGRYPIVASGTANVRHVVIGNGARLTQSGGVLAATGDFTNNGLFVGNGGLVSLTGTVLQTVGGSSTTRFFDLTVGAAGAGLSGPVELARVLTLDGNLATNGQPLTLRSTATGTALVVNNAGAVLGAATVQRHIASANAGPGYRHYSAPVANSTVADLGTPGFAPAVNNAYNGSPTPGSVAPFPTVFGYDQARLTLTNSMSAFDKGFFSPGATTDALAVGRGYTVNLDAAQLVDFVGTLNNGAVPLALARNAAGTANDLDAGWQFLGNPYPAPLDYSRVAPADRANLDPAIYVYSSASQYAGQYRTYVNGVGNPVLPVAQGFFARVSAGQTSAALTFRNSHRLTVPDATAFARPAADPRPLVQLTLRGAAGPADEATVYFEAGATAGYDAAFDAVKLANPTGLNLAARAGADRLAISGLPLNPAGTVAVPLFVGLPATGTYTLHAAQLLNFASGAQPYLRDRQLNTLTDLAQQPSYTFTMNAANTTPRFELVFGPQQVLGTAAAALAAQVALYPNPARTAVFVELPAALGRRAVTAEIVDALGRVVRTQVLPAGLATHTFPLANVATGVYSLRLQTAAGVVVKKLVVE